MAKTHVTSMQPRSEGGSNCVKSLTKHTSGQVFGKNKAFSSAGLTSIPASYGGVRWHKHAKSAKCLRKTFTGPDFSHRAYIPRPCATLFIAFSSLLIRPARGDGDAESVKKRRREKSILAQFVTEACISKRGPGPPS